MEGIFFKSPSEYKDKLDPIKGYLEQVTQYISVSRNVPIDRAQELAKKLIQEKYQDKVVKFFYREDGYDRVVSNESLLSYITNNVNEGNVIAPTLTTYVSPDVKSSVLSEFIDVNVKARAIIKKEGQAAKARGDLELAAAKNNEQNNKKTYNNALSGIFGLTSSIFYNPTAHSTLTSITRTATSITNASNERLLGGNRYIPRQRDVMRSVIYEATYADQDKIKEAVEVFNLHIPTPEEVVSILKWSSDLYFEDGHFYNTRVLPYLKNLTPYQLCNIAYSGDFYHTRMYNETFIRNFFKELIHIPKRTEEKLEDPTILYGINEGILYFAHSVLYESICGYGKDYEKMNEVGLAKQILDVCNNIESVLVKYKLFFNTFLMNNTSAINAHRLRHMRRRSVPLSDTDSSGFTLDEWVTWYKGEYMVDTEAVGVASAMTYISISNVIHQLGKLSMNMNIHKDRIGVISFKNEYLWSSFAAASVSKHYFSLTMIVEGNVFTKPDLEVKGVHLKNSAVPVSVIERGMEMMNEITLAIHNNKKLRLSDIVQEMIDVENMIISSIMNGEGIYLKRTKIKDPSAYSKGPDKSPFQRHTFWEETFGVRDGQWEYPPYDVLKIPTNLGNKTSIKNWLESIEDVQLRGRLAEWLTTNNKGSLPTIYLNLDYLSANGIPEEIKTIINTDRVVFDCTGQMRTILGTLGVELVEGLLIKDQLDPVKISQGVIDKPTPFVWKGNGYRGKGYIVNTKGDKRFSPYVAKLSNGHTIEALYQVIVKGNDPKYLTGDWKQFKGQPPKNPETNLYANYLKLWKMWCRENPELITELRVRTLEAGGILVDFFAPGPEDPNSVNQAKALCDILNNGYED